VTVAHWDEVESRHLAKGEMDATWQLLGEAAGTRGVGVSRVRVAPGKLPTPPHSHGASEELYFVLGGSGLAWQDEDVHEVRPLDCVIQRPREKEHTFVAGPDGLEYLVFGTRHPTEFGWLPRSRAVRLSGPWVEGREDSPWDVETGVEPLEVGEPAPRPANILNVDEVEHEGEEAHLRTAPLATHERSRLWPSPRSESDAVEETPLRAGHLVARPAGTRVSHSFRAGPDGVTMLTYGTRDSNDICWYPRSKKVFWRGIGLIGRIEQLDYFDGEPLEDD
jgi:uncharacterized cupin superfamily protein